MLIRMTLVLGLILLAGSALAQTEQSEYFYEPLDVGGFTYDRAIAADWNGDGRTDLITYNYNEDNGIHSISMLLQQADSLLAAPSSDLLPISGSEPFAIYVEDLNADGRAEIIYISNPAAGPNSSTIDVLAQDSNGELQSAPVTISPAGNWRNLYFEDIDDDSRREIFAFQGTDSGAVNGSIWLVDQTGDLVFSASQQRDNVEAAYNSATPAFADIDGDGFVDFVASSLAIAYSGGASYTFANAISGLPVVAGTVAGLADVDGDALTDIVLTTNDGLTTVYQEAGGGYAAVVVADTSVPSFGQPVAIDDVDADGDADIFGVLFNRIVRTSLQVTPRSLEGSESLLIRDSSSAPENFDDRNTTVGDLNSDGRADLVVPIGGRPHVSYNRFGTFAVVDLALSIQTAFAFNEIGSTVDYTLTIANGGETAAAGASLLMRIVSTARVEVIDIECTQLATNAPMDGGSAVAGFGYLCALPTVNAGQNITVNVKTRALYEAEDAVTGQAPPLNFYLDAAVRADGQVDTDVSNNDASTIDSGAPGNYSLYSTPIDRIFANEASGQIFVFADRQARSPNARVTPVEYRFDSATAEDFTTPAITRYVNHQVGNVGTGRALIELITADGDEGSESLTFRILSRRPGNLTVSATIRDDLSELESSGVHSFEALPPQYRDAARLAPQFEPVDGVLIDLDGDSLLDLVLATGDDCNDATGCAIEAFINSATGFREAPTTVQAITEVTTDIVGGDFNNDGLNDIVISDGSNLHLFAGDGNGGFAGETIIASINSERVAAGDLDGNGATDLVTIGRLRTDWSTPPPDNLEIYMQSTEGVLTLEQSYRQPFGYSGTLSILDLDADGNLDIVTAYRAGADAIGVRQNNGSNVFSLFDGLHLTGTDTDYFGFLLPNGAEIADLDGDGLPEILPFEVGSFAFRFRGGSFDDDVEHMFFNGEPLRFAIADMNGDGLGDYLTLDNAGQPAELPAIRLQQPGGSFLHFDGLDLDIGAASRSLEAEPFIVGDLDSDGRSDVVTIAAGAGTFGNPTYSWIGYNFGPMSDLAVATRTAPTDADAGTNGSAVFRVTNQGAVFDGESSLTVSTSSNVSVTGIYAAAGTCGMAQAITTEAVCLLAPMEAGGFVDVLVEFTSDTAGAANLEVRAIGRETDASPADNAVTETYTVNSVTPPPPSPPTPPPATSGGGGGSLSPVWLILLLIINAGRAGASRDLFLFRRRMPQRCIDGRLVYV